MASANATDQNPISTADTLVGVIYIVEAVLVIFLHILCSRLMYKDKDMRNPTYYFMINLSIVDVVELSIIGIYAGVIILTRWSNDTIDRVASFLALSAWYSNCVLFALIAFARWVAITRPHLTNVIFGRTTLRTLQAASWLLMAFVCFYANVLYPPGPIFPFIPTLYTWGFDPFSSLGRAFTYVNVSFNAVCTLFEMGFNIHSLHYVHKTRTQVQSVSTGENRRREITLLIQCFILGCIFTATYIIFTIVFAFPQLVNVAMCLVVQTVWTANHSVNPIVYLIVNRKLRNRAIRMITFGKHGGNTTTKINTLSVKSIGGMGA